MSRAEPDRSPLLNRPATLEEVYESCTPLLLSGLSRLARQGYRADPATALDLIHDFYLEALPGLFDRFDIRRGRFSTYLYGAFLHFARPRIVRQMRWQAMLADLDEYRGALPRAAPEFSDAAADAAADALARLPKPLHKVVVARIVDGLSERDTAKQLKLSRYFVRQHLTEALGRIAVALGEDRRIPEDLRPMALKLWRDERSLMEIARELGLSRAEARRRYHELLDRLSTVLNQSNR